MYDHSGSKARLGRSTNSTILPKFFFQLGRLRSNCSRISGMRLWKIDMSILHQYSASASRRLSQTLTNALLQQYLCSKIECTTLTSTSVSSCCYSNTFSSSSRLVPRASPSLHTDSSRSECHLFIPTSTINLLQLQARRTYFSQLLQLT